MRRPIRRYDSHQRSLAIRTGLPRRVRTRPNAPTKHRFTSGVALPVDDGGTHWEGSDDWVRAQFTSYLESFFASLLTVGRIFTTEREEVDLCTAGPSSPSRCSHSTAHSPLVVDRVAVAPVVDFNVAWAKAWLSTVNYQRWKLRVKRTVVSSLAAPVYAPSGAPLERVYGFVHYPRLTSARLSACRHPSGAPTDLLDEISDGVSGLSEKLARSPLAHNCTHTHTHSHTPERAWAW